MNTMTWADVAHLYLWSPIQMQVMEFFESAKLNEDVLASFEGLAATHPVHLRIGIEGYGYYTYPADKLIPILRHVQDITKEEVIEFAETFMRQSLAPDTFTYSVEELVPKWAVKRESSEAPQYHLCIKIDAKSDAHIDTYFVELLTTGTAKQLLWLINKGFDMFGLIESGQALRANANQASIQHQSI